MKRLYNECDQHNYKVERKWLKGTSKLIRLERSRWEAMGTRRKEKRHDI